MHFLPSDVIAQLEMDKVIALVKAQCLGPIGAAAVAEMPIYTDYETIERLLQEVHEYKLAGEEKHRFPIRNYAPISNDLNVLQIENYVLGVDALQRVNTIMLQIRDIYKFFKKHKAAYKTLYAIIQDTSFDEVLIQSIQRVIDEDGQIRPDASEELMRIRRKLSGKRKELDKTFRGIVTMMAGRGLLTDTQESFRNGRRVLAVPAEHKRQVRGIIHDESASGKTAFIEPEGVIDLNNDIFDLEQEERREIYKIMRDLSDEIRPYVPVLRKYEVILGRFDVIQAKATIADQMRACKPTLKPHPHFALREARHPLLLLKNRQLDKPTVPYELVFLHGNRILVLSGPNAGGKSIAMKSVGLLQLMLQAGMLVPVAETSEMGIFQRICADIGDQQSLEDDLSTYSSRLKNAKAFVRHADAQTLVLIDEFGSGTDPKIGGAIAEAVLHELHQRQVYGVITTHYSNIKIFAYQTKGIVNGSMQFDKDTLSPTYQMKVGRPGSSFAFEIAEKIGLQKSVIRYARHRTGKNAKAVDDLLVDLQREKQELEELRNATDIREKQLQKLIDQYERISKDYEYKRKKLKLDVKEHEMQQKARTNKELERLVRELKEKGDLKQAKKVAAQVREERQEAVKAVEELREEIYYKPTEKLAVKEGAITVGDFVKLRSGGATGTVESINKRDAVVQMGLMRMTVKLRDLQHAPQPLEVIDQKRVNTEIVQQAAKFDPKIDVRGMRREEVLEMVQEFMDNAILSSARLLHIIHGKGNGILRLAVRQKVREYDAVLNVYHEPDERGGDGVTVVEL